MVNDQDRINEIIIIRKTIIARLRVFQSSTEDEMVNTDAGCKK